MHVNLGIWDKLTRLVIFLLFLSGLVAVGVWYYPLIKQNERMRKRILQLDTQIQQQDQACRQLRASIEALCFDPKSLERLARERLGYAKPGETVIRFEQPVTNQVLRR